MKIVTIFAEKLYAFHYDAERYDELKRLLLLWKNANYVRQFVVANAADTPHNMTATELVRQILRNAREIDDTLYNRSENESKDFDLDGFFKPLNNREYRVSEFSRDLSQKKGRNNYLRIYALKVDTNCYVITGGAIKFTKFMNDRPHTAKEVTKIDRCRIYLEENSVCDAASFYDYLREIL